MMAGQSRSRRTGSELWLYPFIAFPVVPSQRQYGAPTIITRILVAALGCEAVTTRLQQSGTTVALCARFVWLALLFAAPVLALDPDERFHDYVRDNWSVEHGLPQVSVLTITQDGTGYIWLGTQNGIARFDGVRFTVYDRRTSGVDTTMATVSYTDRGGKPWFGTAHGVLRLNQGKLELLRAGNGIAAVQGIAEAADGSMLFATSRGVMRLRDSVIEPAMLEGERTCSLLRDGETLWVGQTGTLTRIDAAGISRFPLPAQAHNACITHLGAAADAGDLWLGTTAGLYR